MEGAPPPAAVTPVKLHAIGGSAAPPDLAEDLRRLARMPREALKKFWQALGPCLGDRLSEETEQLLDAFRAAYGLDRDDLARAIKGCRFLIQKAAKRDLPAAQLREDVDALCPEVPWLKDLLAAGYEPFRAELQLAIRKSAVTAHGKLLVGAQWRLDTIEASEQGAGLRIPLAVLTLRYREGGKDEQITLQALPDMVGVLKGLCAQIVP